MFLATSEGGVKWNVTNGVDHTLGATVPGTLHLDLLKAGILDGTTTTAVTCVWVFWTY